MISKKAYLARPITSESQYSNPAPIINEMQPSKLTKLFFWFILGCFSIFFAELIAGSTAYPFTSILGWLIVYPVYALHILFFFWVVYRFGKPNFYTLFVAGLLFGLYEAYITKIIWISYRPEGPLFTLGGIALPDALFLVFFWHVTLAFILPMFIGETYLTKSKEIVGLFSERARKWGRWVFIFLIIWGGLFTSINSPNLIQSILSPFIGISFLLLLMFIWKKKGNDRYYMRELIPGERASKWIIVLLFLLYIILGRKLNWDKYVLVGLGPNLIVLITYAIFIWIFIKLLKKSKNDEVKKVEIKPFTFRRAIMYSLVFITFAIIGELLSLTKFLLLGSFIFIIPGLILFFMALIKSIH